MLIVRLQHSISTNSACSRLNFAVVFQCSWFGNKLIRKCVFKFCLIMSTLLLDTVMSLVSSKWGSGSKPKTLNKLLLYLQAIQGASTLSALLRYHNHVYRLKYNRLVRLMQAVFASRRVYNFFFSGIDHKWFPAVKFKLPINVTQSVQTLDAIFLIKRGLAFHSQWRKPPNATTPLETHPHPSRCLHSPELLTSVEIFRNN